MTAGASFSMLEGQELTTPSKLTARNFYFEDSIEAMDDRILNFYVVPCFSVDEVFGTFVETDENDHALNIYANYDMQREHKPLEQLCQEILQEQDAPTQEMQM